MLSEVRSVRIKDVEDLGSIKEFSFCVLMCVYVRDDARLLSRALDSIFTNTLQPDQVVVVQDGPVTPCLENVLKKFSSKKMEIVALPKNIGFARALNEGLKNVRTHWIMRADADDINLPTRFSRTMGFLRENADVAIVGSQILEIDSDGVPQSIRYVPVNHDDIKEFLRRRNPFNHMSVAFRRSVVLSVGGYPELSLREDYGLWALTISRGAKCANLTDVLVHATAGNEMYRRRGGMSYSLGEIQLQHLLYHLGIKGGFSAILHGIMRALVFLSPTAFRGWMYKNYLRDRKTATK
jgi:glycosyltransferase involved in cell wall biosynthesis